MSDPGLKERFVAAIKRRFWVRLHMTLILGATGLAGVTANKVLLAVGVVSMLVRYPLAALMSWLAFVAVVRVWLAYAMRRQVRRAASSESSLDASDVLDAVDIGDAASMDLAEGFSGGGGRFSGGGAGGRWEQPVIAARASGSSGSGGSGGFGGFDLDGDELVLVVALVVLVAGILGSGFYLIYEAPSILAEAAFEFALAGGLIRVTRSASSADWVGSVLRGTWKPFTVVLLLSVGFGVVAHWLRPEATRLSEVFQEPRAAESR
jgi:hypothetical protein